MKNMQFWKGTRLPVLIYIFVISNLILYAAGNLYQNFPNAYTWEELFINYEGGFVRRGLMGQVLFMVDSVVPVQIFYLLIYAAIFCSFLYISYKKLSKVFDSTVVAFFFISPVIFLLPVTDRHVFARKDLFVEIILLCIAQICIHCLNKEKVSLYKNTLMISILFVIGMLIHEMTLFYFPMFVVLLGVAYARQKKILQWLILTGALLLAMLLLVVVFSGNADMREAICVSWAQRYPELTCQRALRHIGVSLYDNTMIAFRHHMHWVTMLSFFIGAALSVMPFIFLWKAYRPYQTIQTLFSISPVLRLAFWPALLAPFVLLVIISDYGRSISVGLLSYLFFLYVVFSVQPQPVTPWLHEFKERIFASPRRQRAVCIFIVFYGLFWRMSHYGAPGSSYVRPGALFYLHRVLEVFS
jgi:hypothetical protein